MFKPPGASVPSWKMSRLSSPSCVAVLPFTCLTTDTRKSWTRLCSGRLKCSATENPPPCSGVLLESEENSSQELLYFDRWPNYKGNFRHQAFVSPRHHNTLSSRADDTQATPAGTFPCHRTRCRTCDFTGRTATVTNCNGDVPLNGRFDCMSGKNPFQGHIAKRHNAERPTTKRHNAKRDNAKRHNAKRHNAKRHNAKRHNAKRHNAKRHNANRYEKIIWNNSYLYRGCRWNSQTH